MFLVKLSSLSSLALFFVACSASSQERDVLDFSLQELLQVKVVTASRAEESIEDAPADILVITKKEIENAGIYRLDQLLAMLPGVNVLDASSSTSYNRIAVKGIVGNDKFVILQDGVRISSPTGEDIPVSSNFPLHHLEQVEVIYGPSSALYGADAFSGVVNLITSKKSNQDSLRRVIGSDGFALNQLHSTLSLSDTYKLTVAAQTHRNEGLSLADDYPDVYELTDLIDLGGQTVLQASERESPRFPLESEAYYISLDAAKNFKLSINRSNLQHSTATGTKQSSVDYGLDPVWRTEITNIHFNKQFSFSDEFSSSLNLSLASYVIDESSKFANVFVNFSEGFKYAKGKNRALDQTFSWTMSADEKLIFGYAYEKLSSIPKTADLLSPYDTSLPIELQTQVYPFVGNLPVKIFDIRWTNSSGFVQYQKRLTQRTEMALGARYDHSSTYGSSFNPRLAAIFEIDDKQIAKLFYGKAYLAPTPRFTHDHFGSFSFQNNDGDFVSFFMQIPNTDILPEELETLELKYFWAIERNLKLEASVYTSKQEAVIDRRITNTPESDFIQGGFIRTTQIFDNIGDAKIKGADFRIVWNKNLETGKLSLSSSYSNISGEVNGLNNLNQIPYVPKNSVKLNTSYETENWTFSQQFKWVDDSINTAGELTPSYAVVNFFLRYQLSELPLSISLRVENLFDQLYSVAGEGNAEVLSSVPQPSRQAHLGIRWRW